MYCGAFSAAPSAQLGFSAFDYCLEVPSPCFPPSTFRTLPFRRETARRSAHPLCKTETASMFRAELSSVKLHAVWCFLPDGP